MTLMNFSRNSIKIKRISLRALATGTNLPAAEPHRRTLRGLPALPMASATQAMRSMPMDNEGQTTRGLPVPHESQAFGLSTANVTQRAHGGLPTASEMQQAHGDLPTASGLQAMPRFKIPIFPVRQLLIHPRTRKEKIENFSGKESTES